MGRVIFSRQSIYAVFDLRRTADEINIGLTREIFIFSDAYS